jgi:hypothetical protein
MKETIEVLAFVTDTNRSPIMMIENNKTRSLERTLKESIGKHLNILSERNGRRWGWGWPWKQGDVPNNVKKINGGSVAEALPHAKKVKITIEIED